MDKITPRQAEIIQLFGSGKTYRQIAHELHISRHTVENHIRQAKARSQCATTIQLAVKVMTEMRRNDK